jgi:ribosomal protein S18 acetylase RimI-like enzyme
LPRHPEIPAALIGRLAVATAFQGRGLGKELLMDALVQIIDKSSSIGIYAIVVDAINDQAAAFYEKYGFTKFPSRPDRLFLPIETAKKAFA